MISSVLRQGAQVFNLVDGWQLLCYSLKHLFCVVEQHYCLYMEIEPTGRFTERELHLGEIVPIGSHNRRHYTGQGFIGLNPYAWEDTDDECPSHMATVTQIASQWTTRSLPNRAETRFGLATCSEKDCDFTVPVRVGASSGDLHIGP